MQAAVDLQLGVDESYALDIPAAGADRSAVTASLIANTVWGALRGLETFAQLVSFESPNRAEQHGR